MRYSQDQTKIMIGFWKDFHGRFMQLACEEQGLGRANVITNGKALRRMEVLRAHCDYKDYRERVFVADEVRSFYESLGVELTSEDLSKIEAKMLEWTELEKKAGLKAPETGRWTYGTGAVSENCRERVRLCVVEAGRSLPDFPKATDPEDFWLHHLYLDLLKNNSDLLFCGTKEGGMILSVCVASATFCARLEREAVAGAADRLRTGQKHEESSSAQNNANPSQDAAREAFIDRAIASRKRMESSMSREALDANASLLDTQKSRALLGIEPARLENLRRGVGRKFFDEASLSRVVEEEWKTVLSSRKMPDSHVDLGLTFALTKEYQKALSRASAQLADLLTTAAGSRINQVHLREAIWKECLDFACQLGQWDAFTAWVGKVVHVGWRPIDADGQDTLVPDSECEKRLKERRDFFEGRIGMYSHEWLSAIDQAIELRHTVSASHTVNASGEIERTPTKDKPSQAFSHSPDYRTVTVHGETYTLTARQAQIIEILHKAHEDGNPGVSTAHILEALETKGSRWQDTFRTNPKAKRALIQGGARRGTLRLKL